VPLKKEGKTEERSSWKKKPIILALYEKEAQSDGCKYSCFSNIFHEDW